MFPLHLKTFNYNDHQSKPSDRLFLMIDYEKSNDRTTLLIMNCLCRMRIASTETSHALAQRYYYIPDRIFTIVKFHKRAKE